MNSRVGPPQAKPWGRETTVANVIHVSTEELESQLARLFEENPHALLLESGDCDAACCGFDALGFPLGAELGKLLFLRDWSYEEAVSWFRQRGASAQGVSLDALGALSAQWRREASSASIQTAAGLLSAAGDLDFLLGALGDGDDSENAP